MSTTTGDYSVTVRIKNGRIIRKMRERGIPTVKELADRAGVSVGAVHDVVNMRTRPIGANGEWRDVVFSVAGALLCDPEELFSERQIESWAPKNSFEVFIDDAQLDRLSFTDDGLDEGVIPVLLECLNPRERLLIEKRYFDNGTYREIGGEGLGAHGGNIGIERVRNVHDAALRKMRAQARRLQVEP